MDILIYSLHIMVCFVLIVVVLLQRGKGADMGAMLGGGASNTVFGARGAGNFLTKITAGCAVTFMITSLSLSYLGGLTTGDEIFDDGFEVIEEGDTGAVEADDASSTALEEIVPPAAEGADSGASPDTLEEVPAEAPSEP